MILRRFSQSLKEQNWTAIAVEFVLLVLGVFLGIQVSNWNAEESMRSRYREAFRMSLSNDAQRALGKHCGDRVSRPGDYATLHGILDYPCRTELSAQAIAKSADALRTNSDILRFLRLRIADLETRLSDLTRNNLSVMENLRAIAGEQP